MSNISSTQKMKSAVEYARNRAKLAESEFDRANSEIQRKASRSIDLFGGHVTSSVADIARDARIACDNLFATYQSLIITVDEKCRPLLSQDPDVSAVREVKDLIKWLNEESEIENNFNASLNGTELGDVASRRYIPSIENKMIENYWEDKYMTFPGREETEAKAHAERTERIRIELEERKKVEEEKRAEYDRQIRAYEKEYKEWKAVSKQQRELREKELSEMISHEQSAFAEKLDKAYCDEKYELEKKRNHAQQALSDAQNNLANAGLFSFAAKKEAKARIAENYQIVVDIDKSLEKIKKDYANKNERIKKFLDEKIAEQKKVVNRKYPIPPAPQKPQAPVAQSAVIIVNEEHKAAILSCMKVGKLYTIADIIQNCPEVSDLTNQRVSSLVRQLIPSHIERVEENRKAYFRLVSNLSSQTQKPVTRCSTYVTDDELKATILASMEPGKLYTITDLVYNCSEISDLTNVRVSSVVRQLVPSYVERIEMKRKVYFRLVSNQSQKLQNSERQSAVHLVNEMVKNAILESMEIGELYTIVDIIQNCPEASDLTNQRVSSLVRQLIPSHIERIEKERMAYFRRVK